MAFVRREVDIEVLALFEAAGRNAHSGALLLQQLLETFPERRDLALALRDCEHEGDRLTHEVIRRLRSGGVKAELDIADGHALATALDDVIDNAEQTADWLVLYAVEAPMEPAVQMAGVLVQATAALVEALVALREGADMTPHLEAAMLLEDEGDRIYRDGVASLFVSGIDPMVVIRWKDIFASVEAAVDACKTTAHVLEGIGLKRDR